MDPTNPALAACYAFDAWRTAAREAQGQKTQLLYRKFVNLVETAMAEDKKT